MSIVFHNLFALSLFPAAVIFFYVEYVCVFKMFT